MKHVRNLVDDGDVLQGVDGFAFYVFHHEIAPAPLVTEEGVDTGHSDNATVHKFISYSLVLGFFFGDVQALFYHLMIVYSDHSLSVLADDSARQWIKATSNHRSLIDVRGKGHGRPQCGSAKECLRTNSGALIVGREGSWMD